MRKLTKHQGGLTTPTIAHGNASASASALLRCNYVRVVCMLVIGSDMCAVVLGRKGAGAGNSREARARACGLQLKYACEAVHTDYAFNMVFVSVGKLKFLRETLRARTHFITSIACSWIIGIKWVSIALCMFFVLPT